MDNDRAVISHITPGTLKEFQDAIQGSTWADVTGGMETKVKSMLSLCEAVPGLRVHIFSGIEPGNITAALVQAGIESGTALSADPA